MCSCQKRTVFLLAALALAVVASCIWDGVSSRRGGAAGGNSEASRAAEPSGVVTVYYFHGTIRCQKCLEIERVSRESVEWFYAEDLVNGRMSWRSVNFELPENRHFLDDFNLGLPSLAVECRKGGAVSRIVLSNTWEKVEVPEGLEDYVITGIEAFRAGAERPVMKPVSP